MPYLVVDDEFTEFIFRGIPRRHKHGWINEYEQGIMLPTGSIKRLLKRELTWDDEPVDLEKEFTPQSSEVWTCNECGLQEYGTGYSEEDLHEHFQCGGCGGDEFHLEKEKI